jgi:5-methyltetrahydrofolate--homocysteine methyltransferase
MLIVGERINASRKSIATAIEKQDKAFIVNEAISQFRAGAHFLDVNAGIFVKKEVEYLRWIVATIQEHEEIPLCIDSPNPKAIESALAIHKGRAMVNSISLEQQRFEQMLPLIKEFRPKVIALCMGNKGMPKTADDRFEIASELIEKLSNSGLAMDDIHIDPLVQPISTGSYFGIEFLSAVERIMREFQGVHTICGLSNISYGLPVRQKINRTFAIMAIAKGIDSLIIDPLDKEMVQNITIAQTLAGNDEDCLRFLEVYRSGKFGEQRRNT